MHFPLLASIAALFLGPLLYQRSRAGRWAAAVDGFALVGVGGLVVVHILPQSVALAGFWAVPVALLGLFGPGLFCGTRLFAGRSSGRIAMPIALLGMGLHAALDGVALGPAGGDGRDAQLLVFAVILHRLPVGLGIWWLARPTYGRRTALGLLTAISVFSVGGYLFGDAILANTSEPALALVQALVAGSLLHVILRHPPSLQLGQEEQGWHPAAGLGALVGIALVVWLGHLGLHEEHVEPVAGPSQTFLTLATESAPALLLAYLAVAFAQTILLDLRRWLGGGGSWSQAVRGTFAGLPIPICSCGVIPLYRGLVVQGIPIPAAMSFLVATPELGIASLFLSWSLLGPGVTGSRVLCAIALALAAGWLVGRRARLTPDQQPAPESHVDHPPFLVRLKRGLRFGFGEMVDDTLPWLVVGIGVAALAEPLLLGGVLERLPRFAQVPLFAIAGMPLYVCASGSTPIVAILLAEGASPGAAIAFLLTGPATNVTTFGVLSRLHGRATALGFATLVALASIGLGYGVDALLPAAAAAAVVGADHGEHAASAFEVACLLGLGALLATSLLRQGVRGFIAQVLPAHGHDHAHEHGDHADAGCAVAH
jgi:uncharacterized membrane protein YraQ (UPF0718 family)